MSAEPLKFNPAEATFSRAKLKIKEGGDDAKKQEQLSSLAEKSQQNIDDLVSEFSFSEDERQEQFIGLVSEVENLEKNGLSPAEIADLKEELVAKLMALKSEANDKVQRFRTVKKSLDRKDGGFAQYAQQEENKEKIRAKVEHDFHGGLDRRLIRAYEDLFLKVDEWESRYGGGPKKQVESKRDERRNEDKQKPESEQQLEFDKRRFLQYLEQEGGRCKEEEERGCTEDVAVVTALVRMIVEFNHQLNQDCVVARLPDGDPSGYLMFGHRPGIKLDLPPGFKIEEKTIGGKKVQEMIAGPYRFHYGICLPNEQGIWSPVEESAGDSGDESKPNEERSTNNKDNKRGERESRGSGEIKFSSLSLQDKVSFLEDKLVELNGGKPTNQESAEDYFNSFEQAMKNWASLKRSFNSKLRSSRLSDEEVDELAERYDVLEARYNRIGTAVLNGGEIGLLDPAIAELVKIVNEYAGKGKAEKQKLYNTKERLEKKVEEYKDGLDPIASSRLIEVLDSLLLRSKKLEKSFGHTSLEIQLLQTNSMKDYMEVWFFDDKEADNTRMSAGAEYFEENKKYELSEYERLKINPAIEKIADSDLKNYVKFLRDTTEMNIREIIEGCGGSSTGCPTAAVLRTITMDRMKDEIKGVTDEFKREAIEKKFNKILDKISAQESTINKAIGEVYRKQGQLKELQKMEKASEDAESFMEVMNNMIATGVFHVSSVPEHGRGISSDIEYDAHGNPEVRKTRVLASKFAGGNSMGESAYKKFIQLGFFNTSDEYFDSETQRSYRDKNHQHEDQVQADGRTYEVGAIQELVSIIFTEYLSNVDEKQYNGISFYRSDKKTKEKSDIKKLDDHMMDLIEKAAGKDLDDLKSKPKEYTQRVTEAEAENPRDEEKIAHLKDLQRRYERIAEEMGGHTDNIFAALKFAMKFKIAADNLSTKATYNIAAATDSSMPPAIEMLSNGRYADGIRKMSKQSGSVSGYLDEFVTLFNNDKILRSIPPSEAYLRILASQGKIDISKIPTDPEKRKQYLRRMVPEGSLHDPKFNIMPDIYQRREYVDFPQYQDNGLRNFYKTTLQSIHDAGAPDDSFVMNSEIGAISWFNTETAMQALDQALLVGSGGKDWWDFLTPGSADPTGEKTWAGLHDKINTQVSILEGLAGTGDWLKKKWQAENGGRKNWTEKEQLEYCMKWKEKFLNGDWDNDPELKAISPHRKRLIALTNASMARVFETCTKYILGNREQTRIVRSTQESYDIRFNTRLEAVYTNLGEISGKALDGNYYAPLLKKYLGVGADTTQPGREKELLLGKRSDKFRLALQKFSMFSDDHYTDYQKRAYELRMHLRGNNHLPWLIESSNVKTASVWDQAVRRGITRAQKDAIDHSSVPPLNRPYTVKDMFSAQ